MKLVNTYQQHYSVMVTGASGFAGSHIVQAFSENNYPNLQIACRNRSKLRTQNTYPVLEGDLLNPAYLEQITQSTTVICHAASWTSYYGSKENSERLLLKPSLNLIEKAEKNKVKRFIFLSTTALNAFEQNHRQSPEKLARDWPHLANILKIEQRLRLSARHGMEVIILRVGFFTGSGITKGILPVLLPRLKTRLVPWIDSGRTTLPLVDGRDIGQAFYLAAIMKTVSHGYLVLSITGSEIPTFRAVLGYLKLKYNYSLPWFGVNFPIATVFARLLVKLGKLKDGHPLLFPAVVYLLKESHSSNEEAQQLLGFQPKTHWKTSIDIQMEELLNKHKL